VQDVVAAGAGNVERSSARSTSILRQVSRLILLEKPMIRNVVKKSSGSKAISKTSIVQVGIIVIVALDGNH